APLHQDGARDRLRLGAAVMRHSQIPPWVRMRRGRRRLQARLLLWFIGAICLAVGASMLTTWLTNDQTPSDYPSRVVSRLVQQCVAQLWDYRVATDAYLAQLRDTTGLDTRVRRDPHFFDSQRKRGPAVGGWVFEDGVAYVPVVQKRHGPPEVVG